MAEFLAETLKFSAEFMKEWFKLLAAFAWPAAFLASVYLFRERVNEMLGRLKILSTKGAEFHPLSDHGQSEPVISETGETKKVDEFVDRASSWLSSSTSVARILGNLSNSLNDLSPSEQQERLKHMYAANKALMAFEKLFDYFVDPQISVIKEIKTFDKDGGIHPVHLAAVYKNHMTDAGYKVRAEDASVFTVFLIGQDIIVSKDKRYKLTEFGADFLRYVRDRKQSESGSAPHVTPSDDNYGIVHTQPIKD